MRSRLLQDPPLPLERDLERRLDRERLRDRRPSLRPRARRARREREDEREEDRDEELDEDDGERLEDDRRLLNKHRNKSVSNSTSLAPSLPLQNFCLTSHIKYKELVITPFLCTVSSILQLFPLIFYLGRPSNHKTLSVFSLRQQLWSWQRLNDCARKKPNQKKKLRRGKVTDREPLL